MHTFFAFLSATLLASVTNAQNGGGANFANNLASCVKSRPINPCLNETLEELRTYMPYGIPELNLPPSDPLKIDNLPFNTDPGIPIVSVNALFTNVVVDNLASFQTRRIEADVADRVLHLTLFVPRIFIRGLYTVNGQIFVLKVDEGGSFNSTLVGIVGRGQGRIVPVDNPRTGRKQLTITDTQLDFQIRDARVTLRDRKGVANDVVNGIINDNSGILIDAVKPQIRREMTGMVELVMNDAFSKLDAEDFLQNLESLRQGRLGRGFRFQ